jgi:hypothetical protein
MGQYIFGTGALSVQPVGGGSPLLFASLLDVSVDISGDIKEMNGQYTFPQAVARGKSKIQCKATSGQFDVNLFNQVFFGQTVTAGSTAFAQGEQHSVPTSTAYTITATNGATFVQDMGVVYAATGLPLKQVVSPTTAGQYSVNSTTGVYTFSASDEGVAVLINYTYTVAASGHTLAINNQLMGLAPTFQCTLGDSFNNNGSIQTLTMTLYACTASKLSMPLKADDFMQTDIEWQAQTNAAGQVGFISMSS